MCAQPGHTIEEVKASVVDKNVRVALARLIGGGDSTAFGDLVNQIRYTRSNIPQSE